MHFDLVFTPFQLIIALVLTVLAGFLYWAINRKHYKSAAVAVALAVIVTFLSPVRLTAPTQTVNIDRVQKIEEQRIRQPLPPRVEVDITDRSQQREILDQRTQELRDRQISE